MLSLGVSLTAAARVVPGLGALLRTIGLIEAETMIEGETLIE